MSNRKTSRTEEEIRRRFRDMYDSHLREQDIQIPGPDLSFLQEKKPAKRKHHSALRRLSTIAACMLLLFVTSSGMAVWISSDAAHAVKFSLEKTFHRISGTFFSTDDGSETSVEENQISITIDSMGDIEDAVSFMPDLPVPEYIPEGFELEELTVVKYMDGSYWAEYNFRNISTNSRIMISIYTIKDQEATAGLISETKEFPIGDYMAYYCFDEYTSSYGLNVLMGKQLVGITGDIDQEIMKRIAQNIS